MFKQEKKLNLKLSSFLDNFYVFTKFLVEFSKTFIFFSFLNINVSQCLNIEEKKKQNFITFAKLYVNFCFQDSFLSSSLLL